MKFKFYLTWLAILSNLLKLQSPNVDVGPTFTHFFKLQKNLAYIFDIIARHNFPDIKVPVENNTGKTQKTLDDASLELPGKERKA